MNKQGIQKLGKVSMADKWAVLLKIDASKKAKNMNRYCTEVCLQKPTNTWTVLIIIILLIIRKCKSKQYDLNVHNKHSISCKDMKKHSDWNLQ